jgi:hypothetical protein
MKIARCANNCSFAHDSVFLPEPIRDVLDACPLLASRYPSVTVEPDAIFVHDGVVWTSAGVTSGIDLALALIEEDAGRKAAIEVA